jgi:hypothetical protein
MIEGFFSDCARAFANSTKDKHFEEEKPKDEEEAALFAKEEGFTATGYPVGGVGVNGDLASMIGRILALVFVLLLISFFGQYFWNQYVTKLFTVARPATSVMQILGLFIFIRLMFP